jgi:hypothetical protein
MEGVKMDKYQLDRTDILTFINSVVKTLKVSALELEQQDLIAVLITSFEASANNYILQAQNHEKGLHVMFTRLYEEIRDTKPGELPLYVAADADISTLGKYATSVEMDESQIASMATIYKLSLIRLVDHVYHLLVDIDVWSAFIAPRMKADVTTNLERAKTLRLFSHYLQSLLTYYQFFTLEMTLQGYELVQQWFHYFPPLSTEVMNRVEKVIKPHDVLGAADDARELLKSIAALGHSELNVMTLPLELMGTYGLAGTIAQIDKKVRDINISATITSLQELDKKAYLPLLGGIPVDEINVGQKVTEAVLISKAVDGQIMTALSNLLPSIGRGVTAETLSQLHALRLRSGIPFVSPSAVSLNVLRGAKNCVQGGAIRIDRAAPAFSYEYGAYIRKVFKFAISTDQNIYDSRPYRDYNNVIDFDKVQQLKDILATNWKSLIPSFLGQAERTYDAASFKSEHEIRYLIEQMSGTSYEIAIKEMTLPHRAKMWATFFSSFALLLEGKEVAPGDERPLEIEYTLIPGHGYPYGTDYQNLDVAQGAMNPIDLVSLGDGFYLRFLKKIPLALPELNYDKAFYGHHPVAYFSSNSSTVDVTGFVWGEGLTQFCMTPLPLTKPRIQAKFGTRFIYALKRMVLNFNIFFSPHVPDDAREIFPLPISERSWQLSREAFFLVYKTFGSYSVHVDSIEEQIPSTLAELQQKAEHKEKLEEKAAGVENEVIEENLAKIESKVEAKPEA